MSSYVARRGGTSMPRSGLAVVVALVVALATGLSRGGAYSFVYVGQLAGIALMFAGFTLPAKAARRVEPQRASVRAAAR